MLAKHNVSAFYTGSLENNKVHLIASLAWSTFQEKKKNFKSGKQKKQKYFRKSTIYDVTKGFNSNPRPVATPPAGTWFHIIKTLMIQQSLGYTGR